MEVQGGVEFFFFCFLFFLFGGRAGGVLACLEESVWP